MWAFPEGVYEGLPEDVYIISRRYYRDGELVSSFFPDFSRDVPEFELRVPGNVGNFVETNNGAHFDFARRRYFAGKVMETAQVRSEEGLISFLEGK